MFDPWNTKNRGREHPSKENSLTNAQRKSAYRARHKGQGKPVTVTENVADAYDDLVMENERLREELTQLRHRVESADTAFVGRGSLVVTEALREPIPAGRGAIGDCRLGVTVALSARYAMERLAADIGIPKGVAVERLLYWAD